MNAFQRKVLDVLEPLLKKHTIKNQFETAGVRDSYLHLRDRTHGLDVWVYEDEVAFRCGTYHLQCEKPDFDDSEDMLQFFLQNLASRLDHQQQHE